MRNQVRAKPGPWNAVAHGHCTQSRDHSTRKVSSARSDLESEHRTMSIFIAASPRALDSRPNSSMPLRSFARWLPWTLPGVSGPGSENRESPADASAQQLQVDGTEGAVEQEVGPVCPALGLDRDLVVEGEPTELQ